ncbi:MAG: glycosyltransferase family 4 protein [Chromatiaceae bacterium]|nr:glycosyltransferase family 4 protein [Chromatiaceae bacterium]MCP5438805.1 glycosyltransferase family 4 protein [Chromatiaceae bacterium]MCP5439608.1 glycosyltransferase family 4 protein [Chromatiaceae bacterium]
MTEPSPSRSKLAVLLATTSYPLDSADWKARFIYDLAAAIDRTGEVQVQLWGPPGHLPGDVSSANSRGDTAWLHQMAGEGGIAHLLRTRPATGLIQARGILARLREACARNRADIYHVNWLQLALGLPDDGRPLYVAVLGSDFGLLRLPGMGRLLRRKFSTRPTVLAPNAGWMQARLTELFGDVAEIRPNPFGVTPAWFDMRRQIGEPREWLVVTRITRKKLGDLLRWGKGLFGPHRRLRLLGPMQEDIALPAWIEYGGPTNPDNLRQQWFPGAAGLLTLSRHDEGRPQVMIEAMAAGLPVIASRIPAHADLIRHGETGWLVDSRDELAEALREAETPSAAAEITARARSRIRETIGTWDDYARRCLTAYTSLLQG